MHTFRARETLPHPLLPHKHISAEFLLLLFYLIITILFICVIWESTELEKQELDNSQHMPKQGLHNPSHFKQRTQPSLNQGPKVSSVSKIAQKAIL